MASEDDMNPNAIVVPGFRREVLDGLVTTEVTRLVGALGTDKADAVALGSVDRLLENCRPVAGYVDEDELRWVLFALVAKLAHMAIRDEEEWQYVCLRTATYWEGLEG